MNFICTGSPSYWEKGKHRINELSLRLGPLNGSGVTGSSVFFVVRKKVSLRSITYRAERQRDKTMKQARRSETFTRFG